MSGDMVGTFCVMGTCFQVYAMKSMLKDHMILKNQVTHVKAERDVMAEADDPWIVKLMYSFQVRNQGHRVTFLWVNCKERRRCPSFCVLDIVKKGVQQPYRNDLVLFRCGC